MKHYYPTGRRNHGRPLKRLLDMWDRNGSKSGPTPWQTDRWWWWWWYDNDDVVSKHLYNPQEVPNLYIDKVT
jgi:hypothetical protein